MSPTRSTSTLQIAFDSIELVQRLLVFFQRRSQGWDDEQPLHRWRQQLDSRLFLRDATTTP
jgi:hypothetical protein